MFDEIRHDSSAWHTRVKLVSLVFALIAAFFLFFEHRAHVFAWLPWLFLAACPLMHLFMHHGHGRHDHGNSSDSSPRANSPPTVEAGHDKLPGVPHPMQRE